MVATSSASRTRRFAEVMILRYGMVWVLVALTLVARAEFSGFFELSNLNNLVNQMTPIAIIAIGMTFVIIGGGFDLSVGALFAAATVAYASLSNHMPLWLAFVLTLAIGVVAGIVNGILITVFKINTFIATLGSSSLFVGVTYRLAANDQVLPNSPSFQTLGTAKWGGLWLTTYVLVVLIVIAWVVLHRTTFGRSVYAVGGNPEAARLSGKRVRLLTVATYIISAGCAAIAGMLAASQSGVGQANIGSTTALEAITIVIVGGTSLLGGEGAMWRTVVGALIVATINDVFQSLGVSVAPQMIATGGILIIAVTLDSLTRRRRV